ncbi:MAG: methyltransferase domain-containing protein [Candidatus Cloacimonetes bacterium]|nr:methyltransferase domain-containing protein [Candidatus Cloacimonadota bacterium]
MPIIEPFEKHFREYEKWFDKYLQVYQSELLAIKSIANVAENAIEIGIGNGLFAKPLEINKGIDPSAAMRKKAEERGLTVLEGVAENLPLADNSIDYALMITTICFVDNPQKALYEVHRILKPGGVFVIGFVDEESPLGNFYQKHKNNSLFYKDAIFFSTKNILQLFKQTGFLKKKILQTVFGQLDEIQNTQKPEEGYGKRSFVVIKGVKDKS